MKRLFKRLKPAFRIIKPVFMGCCVVVALALATLIMIEDPPLSAENLQEAPVVGAKVDRNRYGKADVTIRVKDDNWSGTKVVSAALDGRDIRLHKRANVFGLKGTMNTRLPQGDYVVRWTVTKPSSKGNRITLSFSKSFRINRYTERVTVVINGQKASVY